MTASALLVCLITLQAPSPDVTAQPPTAGQMQRAPTDSSEGSAGGDPEKLKAQIPGATDAPANRQHTVSITFAAAQLILKLIELTTEFRVGQKGGVAAILGGGSSADVLTVELGAQVRYYLVGSFSHGVHIGAEVLGASLTGRGFPGLRLGLGPFVGYKLATNLGLTFEAQIGPSLRVETARGEVATGPAVLFHLNVGWSF